MNRHVTWRSRKSWNLEYIYSKEIKDPRTISAAVLSVTRLGLPKEQSDCSSYIYLPMTKRTDGHVKTDIYFL